MLTKLVTLTYLFTLAFTQDVAGPAADASTNSTNSTEPEVDPITECRRLACYIFTPDGTAYDLTPLTKLGEGAEFDYLQPLKQDVASLEFNFCQKLHRADFFARRLQIVQPYTTILTSGTCAPDTVDTVTQGEEIIGIEVVQKSENVCNEREDGIIENYSFKFIVLCDETVTEDGGAIMLATDGENPCQPAVTFQHAAGCHKAKETVIIQQNDTVIIETEVQPLSELIFSNPYLFGGFLLVIGIAPAFAGTVWFKYICGLFGGFSAIVVSAFSLEALEYMDNSSLGFWPCVGISVLVGIIVGLILLKFVMIGSILIGLTFGAVVGLMCWSFINSWMTWKHWVPALTATCIGAALGVFISSRPSLKSKTVMYGTSFIGSYTLMRGVSLISKGFIGEQKMARMLALGEPVELEWQTGFYVALLYLLFTITSFFQFRTGEKADAMTEQVKSQGNDLADIQNEVKDEEEYDN